ncbi:hypothetical protein CASFOL_036196 [Castilleja foliolosa]|uniref:DUF4005 domain-containing protein n=1 Tax=Castilleja foliolosa TaxID=1961234 RepID=A0ABD3BVH8_9LAMI
MVRKGNWFSSVKKALSPDTSEKKSKKANKSKKKWFGKEKPPVASESPNREIETVEVTHPHPLPPLEDVKLAEVENEETKHAYDVAVASAAAAEAAVAAAQAAAEVVHLTTVSQFAGKSIEEVAAIKIQTAFRGYLARRALRALRGLVRLKSLVDGPTVIRQTSNTLKCMQTLSRVQSQIQSRRLRMLEENRALQRQILQKRAKEFESLRVGEEWDHSLQSKEKIESNLLHKYEAAMRRERALAYSYTHQQAWKKSSKSTNLLFMDPTNPHWGWSWLERWMAARPWETQVTTTDKDSNSSIKSPGGEITKAFARYQLNSDNNASSPSSQKPPSPFTPSKSSIISKKIKHASSKGSAISQDDDSRSTFSMQSEIKSNRRHTIGGGSSVRDDESLGSSSSVPSYMATTRSARAKLRLASPLGMENGGNSNSNTPDKGSVKKRLSFPASPARPPRRHSGPPKVETISDGTINEA